MDRSLRHWEHHFALPEVQRVSAGQPLEWLRLGWSDLTATPGPSLSYGLAFAVGGWLIFGLGMTHAYVFTAAASGFFLVAPLLAAGLYELSRRHAAGESASLNDSFACWRRNSGGLAMFGLLLAIVAIAWERLTAIMFALFGGGAANPADPAMFMLGIVMSGDYPWLVASWALIGFLLAASVFVISAISIPMMVDKPVDFATAIAASVKAVNANRAAMLVWAALIVLLTAIGMATMMLGLIVLMPVLGHATWHAYREIVR